MADVLKPGPTCCYSRLAVWLLATLLAGAYCCSDSSEAAVQSQRLSPQTYQRLSQIHEYLEQERYDTAAHALEELLPEVSNGGYEKAVVLQTLGHIEALRDRYPAAIKAYEQSLALLALPSDAQHPIRYNLAQLYLASGSPVKAIPVLLKWFEESERPSARAWFLLGSAYLQAQQYHKAVEPLKMAIAGADAPEEVWYQALLAAQYEIGAYAACADLLEEMVRLFPDAEYWRQMAGIYLTLNRYDQALAVLELADYQGMLTSEQDVLQLVQLYLYQGIPYKAAVLLQVSLEGGRVRGNLRHRELLANAWSEARERDSAIRMYEQVAASSSLAEPNLHLAQLYMEDERWRAASRALEAALDKDGLRDPGNAWLLLGISRCELEEFGTSRAAFENAVRYDGSRDSARQWLEYLDDRSDHAPDG